MRLKRLPVLITTIMAFLAGVSLLPSAALGSPRPHGGAATAAAPRVVAVSARVLDARVLRAPPDKELLVVVYRCRRQRGERPRLSPEHRQAGWFGLARAESLTLPPGTLRSLRRALDSGT